MPREGEKKKNKKQRKLNSGWPVLGHGFNLAHCQRNSDTCQTNDFINKA
jgi:hypothetical protein